MEGQCGQGVCCILVGALWDGDKGPAAPYAQDYPALPHAVIIAMLQLVQRMALG